MDTTKKVNVTMSFKESIAIAAGVSQTEFLISTDVKQAVDDIRGHFANLSIQGLLYTITINGRIYSQAIESNYSIREGDEITILPTISGG